MISRRTFLAGCLGAAASGALGAAKRPRLRCRPIISGPLWWYDPAASEKIGEVGWREELEEQAAIGFNLLWLSNAPAALASEEATADLRTLMDLCGRRKVRVLLDTGGSPMWYGKLELEKELALCGDNIAKLGKLFHGHPAFWGWYVPHEIYVSWGDFAAYIDALYPALAKRCKQAANLPVTLSPFFILDRDKVFGDFRYTEPEEYERYWARLIRQSGFDVIMLQDSGEHFSYVTNEMRRPFFAAMRNACRHAGAKLWGNVETAEFECPSKEEYVRRYGRIHHATVKNASWRPVPMLRLKNKLELAAEYSDDIVTWGYREYCRPALGEAGRRWYGAYRAYYRAQARKPRGG